MAGWRAARAAISVVLAAGTLMASAPSTAWAQPAGPVSAADLESARNLNREGKELRARGDLFGAISKFRAAHELGRTPVTGLELARTQVQVGQLVEAREVALGIARMPVAPDETEKSASARDEASRLAEELRPRIPTLIVHLSGVPQGRTATLLVDKIEVPAAQIGEPRKVNPGKHEVAARVGNGAESVARVDLPEGMTQDVQLAVVAPPEPPPDVAPAPGAGAGSRAQPQERTQMRTGVVVTGFTVAGVGALIGGILGSVALDRSEELEGKCPNFKCGAVYHDQLREARGFASASTVMFAIAGGGLVLGVIGLAFPVKVRAEVGLGGVGVRGAF